MNDSYINTIGALVGNADKLALYRRVKLQEADFELARIELLKALQRNLVFAEFDFSPYVNAEEGEEPLPCESTCKCDDCSQRRLVRDNITYLNLGEIRWLFLAFIRVSRELYDMAWSDDNRFDVNIPGVKSTFSCFVANVNLKTVEEGGDEELLKEIAALTNNKELGFMEPIQRTMKSLRLQLMSGLDVDDWCCYNHNLCGYGCRRGDGQRHVPWQENFWNWAATKVVVLNVR